ncbi:MAG TPA: 50S ribosomal protein L23 [Candidatus Methylomirabilis sp.]|nr:50S ribosomal protein L23 [Candidatus Methylomirabilis sp.]
MSFLDRFTKKSHAPKAPKAAPASDETAKADQAEPKEKKGASNTPVTILPSVRANIILKPHVSEKAAYLADRGVYVFDVPLDANKVEVRKAIEALYKVSVIKVRTERGIGKVVRRGRITGKRNSWKKALVEVKKGQSINLVEGV